MNYRHVIVLCGTTLQVACSSGSQSQPEKQVSGARFEASVSGIEGGQPLELEGRRAGLTLYGSAEGEVEGGSFEFDVANEGTELGLATFFTDPQSLGQRVALDAHRDSQVLIVRENQERLGREGWVELTIKPGGQVSGALSATVGADQIEATFSGEVAVFCFVPGASGTDAVNAYTLDNESAFCREAREKLGL